MDAFKYLESHDVPDPIDEKFFKQLQEIFQQEYLNLKNYDERVELHRNPYEVKREVLDGLYAYLQEIDRRDVMRDIDTEKKASGYVSTKIKEIWQSDKRLQNQFEAVKRYCEIRSKHLSEIAVHIAEYYAMSKLAEKISHDINNNAAPKSVEPEITAENTTLNAEQSDKDQVKAWDVAKSEKLLQKAFDENSELQLLDVLKNNSFLFYELYTRKYAIQPVFHEVNFGAKLRCDFAWLNDNSDGPEWVLVEVEKPKMKAFTKSQKPTSELNAAIEQIRSWDRYFKENPAEKRRIFGAVSRFRFILIAGNNDEWSTEHGIKWRAHNNAETNIEIRSADVFTKTLELVRSFPHGFWSFEENPVSMPFTELERYWQNNSYMGSMRKIFN